MTLPPKLRWTLGFLLISIGTTVFSLKVLLPSKLKTLIEKKASSALGVPVEVARADLKIFPSLTLTLKDLKASFPAPLEAQVLFPYSEISIPLSLDVFNSRFDLTLVLNEPTLALKDTLPESPPPKNEQPAARISVVIPETPSIGLHLKVKDAHIHVAKSGNEPSQFELDPLSFTLEFKDLLSPITLDLSAGARLQKGTLDFSTPVKIKSKVQWNQAEQKVDVQDFESMLSIFVFKGKGQSLLSKGATVFDASFEISDFQKVRSLLPKDFPLEWSGTGKGNFHYETTEKGARIANGTVEIPNLQGEIHLQKSDLSIVGPFRFSSRVDFSLEDETLKASVTDSLDLTSSEIKYKDLLTKPAKTTFFQTMSARYENEVIFLRPLDLQVGPLKTSIQGSIKKEAPYAFHLQTSIPKTELSGLEKLFPVFGSVPVKGVLAGEIEVSGDTTHMQSMEISASPIRFEKIEASLDYKKDNLRLNGPFVLNGNIQAHLRGKDLESASLGGELDLTHMLIQMNDKNSPQTSLVTKSSGQKLNISLQAEKVKSLQGQFLKIKQSQITAMPFSLSMAGQVQTSAQGNPSFDLKIFIPSLNLTTLASWVPILASYKLKGTSQAQLSTQGTFDLEKGFMESPITISGKVEATLPELTYNSVASSSVEKAVNKEKVAAATKKPAPILEDSPVVRRLKLNHVIRVQKLFYNKNLFEGLSWQGSLDSGKLSGSAVIAKIFGGSVRAPLRLTLTQAAPSLEGEFSFTKIRVEDSILAFLPEWKELASGIADGSMKMNLAHPSRADFLSASEVSGSAKIANGSLKTLPFKKMLDEKLSKIPQFASAIKPPETLKTSLIQTKFLFSNAKLNIESLNVISPDSSELNVKGSVSPDKTFNLEGRVFLANPPVQGPFLRANADSKNRLIVPIHLKGNVYSPEFSLFDVTVKEMLSRTASYEGQRLKSEAETTIRKEAEKQKQSFQKRAEDEAKKALKGIFGQ